MGVDFTGEALLTIQFALIGSIIVKAFDTAFLATSYSRLGASSSWENRPFSGFSNIGCWLLSLGFTSF